jgi:SH3-like domain-containing protein
MVLAAPAHALRLAACGALLLAGVARPGWAQTRDAAPVVRPHGPAHAATAPEKLPLPPPPAPPPPAPPPQSAPPAPQPPPAKPPPDPTKGTSTGLPIPRFVALRADKVNLRAGPGDRYPIEWVYQRRDLPVEIEREFDVWRLIKDQDGIRGWVQEVLLSGRRSFLVTGADRTLRREPDDAARPVAILKLGVIGRIRACPAKSAWCEVQVDAYRGWLKRSDFWGALPDEVIGN